MLKITVDVDMDGTLVDFQSAIEGLTWEEKEAAEKIEGFFLNLEPVDYALGSIRILDKYFDVEICSTAPWQAPYAWMENVYGSKNICRSLKNV